MTVARRKKATNVTVDPALLGEARALGINISSVLEQGLRERVAEARRAQWLADNAEAIDDYNERIAKNGVFGDRARTF